MSLPRDETLSREEISSHVVVLGKLPLPWAKEGCPEGFPGWRMVIKGRIFGADWEGRVDLWWRGAVPPEEGDVIRIKEMRVQKRGMWMPQEKKAWAAGTKQPGYHQIDMKVKCPLHAFEAKVDRNYIRLESCNREPKGYLVWEEARSPLILPAFDGTVLGEVSGISRSRITGGEGRLMIKGS